MMMPSSTTRPKTFFDRTGLGRSLDPRHPISRRGVVGSLAAGAISLSAMLIANGTFDLPRAFAAGVATFLAWAIARELDPDRPRSADLAMVGALLATFAGDPSLGATGVALIAARLVAGTVGRRLYPGDLLVLVGVAAYAGTKAIAWSAGLALLGAVVRRQNTPRWATAAIVVAGITGALVSSPSFEFSPTVATLLLAGLAAVFAVVTPRPVGSKTDAKDRRINTHDVRMARLTAASIVVGATALVPAAGWALAPIVAALGGSAAPSRTHRGKAAKQA